MTDAKQTPDPDTETNLTAEREEQAFLADEQAGAEMDAEAGQEGELAPAEDKVEYIEFLGTNKEFGVEFYKEGVVGHSVTRKELREAWDVDTPKDLKWTKMAGGPHKGRMLVKVEDMSPAAAEGFANDPMFRRVTL
jgi:hypothetical protein